MSDLAVALGLALAIEGVALALFPEAVQRMMQEVLTQPAGVLRIAGVAAVVVGVVVVWVIRGG